VIWMTSDLAPGGWQGSPRPAADPTAQVIVVGLDGSPASWDAFCWAAGQATRARGSLIAVYATSAVTPVVAVPGDFAYAEQAAQEVAAELKAEAEHRAAEVGVQLTFVREPGDTVRALISVARSAHADLVVVGRSAKMLHHMAGSAGRRLASRHDAPVVVVVP
jgi:nucleotide-binding universal stress UspA family protein